MAAALQIQSHTFSKAFDALTPRIQSLVGQSVDDMGIRLADFPNQRLKGRSEFKLRVGDYRVIYEFDVSLGRIWLHYVGHRREIYRK